MFSSLITLGAVSASFSLVGAQTTSGLPITGLLGNAPKLTNNTVGVLYTATLPLSGSIQGFFSATSANGTGVQLASSFSGLPSTGGYFLYYVTSGPVPSDGNCSGTGGVLDPYKRGIVPPCDPALKQTCAIGDESGKYGFIDSDPYALTFTSAYISTTVGSVSYLGDKALLVTSVDGKPLACANFTMTKTNASVTSPAPTTTPTAVKTSAAGAVNAVSITALGMGLLMYLLV